MLRDLGDRPGMADALAALGRVALDDNEYGRAHDYLVASLAIRRELGHRLVMPAVLEDLAALAAATGDTARAARLAGTAEGLRAELGAPAPPSERRVIERWLAPLLASDPKAVEAYAAGRVAALNAAIDDAIASRQAPP